MPKLLTTALAKKTFTKFPYKVYALVGQFKRPMQMNVLKKLPKGYMIKIGRSGDTFAMYAYKGRLSVGSGADPVFIYSRKPANALSR